MGKISELWKKVKGMFNKNKALPEGREVMEIVDNQYEMEKESGHEIFLKELQSKAKEFDPSTMLKEDAIMKILEEKGMNEELSKNPAAKSKITEIATEILESNGIERITKDNLEEVKWRITNISHLDNSANNKRNGYLKIQEDGSIKYLEDVEKYEGFKYPMISNNSSHFFMEEGSFKVKEVNTDKMNFIETIENKNIEVEEKWENTVLHVYNKNGLEMRRDTERTDERSESRRQVKVQSEKDQIIRQSDLVTARTYSQKNGKGQGAVVCLDFEHPEILNTRTNFDVDNVINKKEQNKLTYENGFIEIYDPLKDGAEVKERVEKQNEELKKIRESAIRRSPEFKKTAMENGLIKEETLEQE